MNILNEYNLKKILIFLNKIIQTIAFFCFNFHFNNLNLIYLIEHDISEPIK
mgnify:FL=1